MKKLSFEGRHECGLNAIVAGKDYAFVAVLGEEHPARIGVAIRNEPGYYPVPEHWAHADTLEDMQAHVDELNAEAGLTLREAAVIIATSMRR